LKKNFEENLTVSLYLLGTDCLHGLHDFVFAFFSNSPNFWAEGATNDLFFSAAVVPSIQ
jgi:hypothetical protein